MFLSIFLLTLVYASAHANFNNFRYGTPCSDTNGVIIAVYTNESVSSCKLDGAATSGYSIDSKSLVKEPSFIGCTNGVLNYQEKIGDSDSLGVSACVGDSIYRCDTSTYPHYLSTLLIPGDSYYCPNTTALICDGDCYGYSCSNYNNSYVTKAAGCSGPIISAHMGYKPSALNCDMNYGTMVDDSGLSLFQVSTDILTLSQVQLCCPEQIIQGTTVSYKIGISCTNNDCRAYSCNSTHAQICSAFDNCTILGLPEFAIHRCDMQGIISPVPSASVNYTTNTHNPTCSSLSTTQGSTGDIQVSSSGSTGTQTSNTAGALNTTQSSTGNIQISSSESTHTQVSNTMSTQVITNISNRNSHTFQYFLSVNILLYLVIL